MDEKQSRISQFFKRLVGRKPAEQSNTPPAAQLPSEGASVPLDKVSSKASSEPPCSRCASSTTEQGVFGKHDCIQQSSGL